MILKTRPEFSRLSDSVQSKIVSQNSIVALSLHNAQSEALDDGLSQILLSQGDHDKDLLRTVFKQFFKDTVTRPPMSNRVVNKFCNALNEEELVEINSLAKKVAVSVDSKKNLKLMTMILLTDCPELSNLNRWYEHLYLKDQPSSSKHFGSRLEEYQRRQEQFEAIQPAFREIL